MFLTDPVMVLVTFVTEDPGVIPVHNTVFPHYFFFFKQSFIVFYKIKHKNSKSQVQAQGQKMHVHTL